MAGMLPEVKKKVNAFLVGEEGKISKKSLIKTGAFLGAIAVGSAVLSSSASAQATHSNTISGSFDGATNTISGTHTHHGSHSSHGSHGSHGSHSSSF